jgi:hypothetical protein
MAADCYPCKTGSAKLAVKNFNANEPVGCCKHCHVLACGLHGTRIASGPIFVCVDCVPTILTTSAASLLTNKDRALKYLGDLIGLIPPEWVYESLEEFRKKNPDYREWVKHADEKVIDWQKWKPGSDFRQMFEDSNADALRLLVAAGLIIRKLYRKNPPSDYPEDLVILSNAIVDGDDLNTIKEPEYEATR